MPDNRVFLPRLPEGATEEVLKAHFGHFGEITDCCTFIAPLHS